MSILSSLYHGEIHDKPNDVHNVPAGAPQTADGQAWMNVPLAGADGGAAQTDGESAPGAGADARGQHTAGENAPAAENNAHAAQAMAAHAERLASAVPQNGGPADCKSTDGSGVLPAQAKRRIRALQEGNLRPPLYYTGQEQTPCASGVWESPHTVASKLESKEEFPQG